MVSKVNFPKRVEEAKASARFAIPTGFKGDKVRKVLTPGHDGRYYHIILKTIKVDGRVAIRGECLLDVGAIGKRDCPGASRTVCYHTMAAIVYAARKNGQKVSFCISEEDAKRISNLTKGKMFPVVSRRAPAGSGIWIVVRDK